MSIGDDLLIILGSYHGGYRLMRKRIRGYTGPADFRSIKQRLDAKEKTIRMNLYRLKKNGFIENENNMWRLTKIGADYIKERITIFKKFPRHHYEKTKKKIKNMIIAFDIPEVDRKKRDWLRKELVALGFTLLQKSVWFGPAPLPKDFSESLVEINLLKFMKFFEAREKEII